MNELLETTGIRLHLKDAWRGENNKTPRAHLDSTLRSYYKHHDTRTASRRQRLNSESEAQKASRRKRAAERMRQYRKSKHECPNAGKPYSWEEIIAVCSKSETIEQIARRIGRSIRSARRRRERWLALFEELKLWQESGAKGDWTLQTVKALRRLKKEAMLPIQSAPDVYSSRLQGLRAVLTSLQLCRP